MTQQFTQSPAEGSLIAYKAFDENMQCRGFQYEVGKTYTHDGRVKMCSSGFHACENPLDTLNYYPLVGSRFAIVEYAGEVERKSEGDSKVCGATLTVKAEVKFGSLIEKAVGYIIGKAKEATSGDRSPAATSGECSPAATSGDHSPAATSGECSHAATSGDHSPAATLGDCSPAATSGDRSPAATSGDRSPAATSGDYSPAATSGDRSPAATSGNYSHAATSGDHSPAATSGDHSPAATSGDRSHTATSGDYSPAEAKGKNSAAAAIGRGAKARAGKTGGVALAEYDNKGNLVAMFASLVGENGIEPDTWYRLENGGPVKCTGNT